MALFRFIAVMVIVNFTKLRSFHRFLGTITLRFQTMNFDATFGIVPSCFSQAFAVSIYLTIKCMLGIHKVE